MVEDHPSGRPVRPPPWPRRLPIYRYPRDGFLTPRLNMRITDAIGFRTLLARPDSLHNGDHHDRER